MPQLDPLTLTLLAATLASVGVYAAGIWATARHVRRRTHAHPAPAAFPPVSLVKPLKGVEEQLEQNLRACFEQDYPAPIELVFSSCEAHDPALEVARRVAASYPHVPSRFVRSDPSFGLNPKVANLEGARAAARYDLVLHSDANVRMPRDYLRRVVSELLAEDAGLLSSMVVGVGERSVGAAMENLQLSALIAPATCAALHVAGVTCVIGKSMLFRRSQLAAVGGFESVRDILCEDFIIGRAYERAGLRVVLSATAVQNVNERASVRAFLGRHSRWLKMRAVIHLGSFLLDLLSNPFGLAVFAWLSSGLDPSVGVAVGAVLALKLGGDLWLVRATRGEPMAFAHLALGPLKDLLMLPVWGYSAVSRSARWRGVRLRFGRDSRLRPDEGNLSVRVARRLLG